MIHRFSFRFFKNRQVLHWGCGVVFAVSVFSAMALHRDRIILEYAVFQSDGGHLSSLSPFYEYLSKAENDPGELLRRSESVQKAFSRVGAKHSADEILRLLDRSALEKACGSSALNSSSGTLARHCENLSAPGDSPSGIRDCSLLRFEENRKACRQENDKKFSNENDSHCSTADCVIDNAVFQASLNDSPPCLNVHSSLQKNCAEIFERYSEYRKNPSAYLDETLESAILGKTSDPVWLAARSGVLEYPDSPWVACGKFSGSELETCEARTKELFSYVQKRGLKNRLERIDFAVSSREIRKLEDPSAQNSR